MNQPALPIEDHQLWNAVTVRQVRRALSLGLTGCEGCFRSHPLVLPRHEKSDVWVDYSVLRVELPLQIKRPRVEVEEMLEPLARLCEKYEDTFPEGQWRYEWYYLELLDRDGECQPLCWVDVKHLVKHLGEGKGSDDVAEQLEGSHWYPRTMITMDKIAGTLPTSEEDRRWRDKWREWFVRTWRANERQWVEEGFVVGEPVRPWSQVLEFIPEYVDSDIDRQRGWEPEKRLASWRQVAYAGYPGLYWKMLPLYDERDIARIWDAMKLELYRTSVFSPSARRRQDPRLWKHLEQRFALPFQRMSRYRYYIRLRERCVLEWTREGKSLTECARGLVEKGLYPLDTVRLEPVTVSDPSLAEQYLEGARRVVIRIRKRLREEGQIERGKPGRPKKKQ